MTNEAFEKLCEEILEEAKEVRNIKAEEYTGFVDRLSNFKQQAAMRQTTILDAIGGNMCKHTASIYQLIKEDRYTKAVWEEKIIDHINYLLLAYAAVVEAGPTATLRTCEV